MKTKNRKWIGPVPITLVAVFALAAFVAAGFLVAPNPAQALGKGECGFVVDDTTTVTGSGDIDTLRGTSATDTVALNIQTDVNAMPCYVTGDSVEIKVENITTAATSDPPHEVTVLASGGRQFRHVADTGAKNGVDQHDFDLLGQKESRGKITVGTDPAKPSLTVTKSMADADGVVILTAYDEFDAGFPLASADTELPTGHDVQMRIVFLGAPAVGVDDDCDDNGTVDDVINIGDDITPSDCAEPDFATPDEDSDNVDTDEVRSRLDALVGTAIPDTDSIAEDTFKASVTDGKSKDIVVPLPTDTEPNDEVQIRATVKDDNNNELEGQEVVMTLTSDPAGIVPANDVDEDTEADGTADFEVDVPKTGSFRITAKFTVGTLNLGSIVIARAGDLDMVSAEACAMKGMGEEDIKMDGCMTGYNPKMIYGPSTDDDPSTFSIYAMATDIRGTKATTDTFMVKPATAATWWDTLNCMEMNDAVMPMDDEPPVGPDDMTSPYCKMYAGLSAEAEPVVDRAFGKAYGDATKAFNVGTGTTSLSDSGTTVSDDGMLMLTVKNDAPGAKYLLDVIATMVDDDKTITKSDQVQVIVSSELKEYMVDGPDYIALDGNATYTVTAWTKTATRPFSAPTATWWKSYSSRIQSWSLT